MKIKVKEFRPGYPISFNNLTKTFISIADPDLRGAQIVWDTEQKEMVIHLKNKILHVPQTNVAFYETDEDERLDDSTGSETSSSSISKTRPYKTVTRV